MGETSMKLRALFAVLSLIGLTLSPLRAEDAKPALVLTYLELSPDAAVQSRDLLKTYAAAAQKAAGVVQFETFQRIGQRNHFAIVEAWADGNAREAFAGSPAAKEFRGKIDPLRIGPCDERQHSVLNVGPKVETPATAIVGITHVDLIPTSKDEGTAMLKTLADQSRGTSGNIRYDIWVQANRDNHMTIVESWKSMAGAEHFTTDAATRTFREKLMPMSGSLYDQRLYRLVR
jgi:quinol monooxygenase YgiN